MVLPSAGKGRSGESLDCAATTRGAATQASARADAPPSQRRRANGNGNGNGDGTGDGDGDGDGVDIAALDDGDVMLPGCGTNGDFRFMNATLDPDEKDDEEADDEADDEDAADTAGFIVAPASRRLGVRQ